MATHRLSSGNINFKCVHAFASRTRTNLVYHEKYRITGFELFRRQQVVPVQFRSFWCWGFFFLSSASVWICCAIDRCGACERRLPVAKLLVISFILANKSVTKYLLLCSLPRGEGQRLPTTRSAGGLSVLSPTATFIVVVKTCSSGITNYQNDLFQFCHETFVSLHLCSAEDSV